MAKAPMNDDDAPKKKRRGASVLVWVLMAMIFGGLGSYGVTNFGGGVTAIGTVGNHKIDVNDYARALHQQMNAFSQQIGQPVSFAQAQALGLDRQVLQSVINAAALDNEAEQVGLSVGDASVAAKLQGIASFQSVAGKFDREAYRQVLQQNNLTEAGFEANLRGDLARQTLQTTLTAGFTTPAALTDTLAAWAGEQRGFSLLRLGEAGLATPLPKASDADLTAFYTAHIADYTRPEAKRITYVTLLPDALAKAMPVDEAKLKEAYQARFAEFNIPEKRLVERLAFANDADAAAAKARLDAGESFETLVKERKLTLEDVDMGDVSKADLGAAGDAVFAPKDPGVVGPLPSDIGPALFRMNAILAAQVTTFDQAKAQLTAEAQLAAARAAIATKSETVNDLLAGGATLQEVAKEQGMTLATTEYAAGADDNDAITQDKAFSAAADKLASGDYPEAILLTDGGLVAMQLDATVPPTPRPFDKVKDKVAAAQHAAVLAKALADQAASIKTAVEAGATLGAYGIVDRNAHIDRQGQIADAPADVLSTLFKMKEGEVTVVSVPGFTAVLKLDSITAAPATGDDAKTMREAININAAKAIAQDAMALYTAALIAEAGITLDQAAINAVNSKISN